MPSKPPNSHPNFGKFPPDLSKMDIKSTGGTICCPGIRIETMGKVDPLKAARQRIKETEAAWADAQIDPCLK
jgi:hypothetical protein